jgi:hypothetical protein
LLSRRRGSATVETDPPTANTKVDPETGEITSSWASELSRRRYAKGPDRACRFRKLHPLDSRSLANQNMIAGCSLLPSFLSAFYATASSRDDGLKPKFWCCGISSTSCNSGCHVGYI